MNLTHGQKVWCQIDGKKKLGYVRIITSNAITRYLLEVDSSYVGNEFLQSTLISLYKIRPYKDINDITTYEVGDRLVNINDNNMVISVEFISGNLFAYSNVDRPGMYNLKKPSDINKVWKFKDHPEPQKTTVTRQEIADWKGVALEDIEITN